MEDWKELFVVCATAWYRNTYPKINVRLFAIAVGDQIIYKVVYQDAEYMVLKSTPQEKFRGNANFSIPGINAGEKILYYINVPYWK